MSTFAHRYIRIDYTATHLALYATNRSSSSHPGRVLRIVTAKNACSNKVNLRADYTSELLTIRCIKIVRLLIDTLAILQEERLCRKKFCLSRLRTFSDEHPESSKSIFWILSTSKTKHRLCKLIAILFQTAHRVLAGNHQLIHNYRDRRNHIAICIRD